MNGEKKMDYSAESLRLHKEWGGKIEVNSRVSVNTKDELALAYTPGVRSPALRYKRI